MARRLNRRRVVVPEDGIAIHEKSDETKKIDSGKLRVAASFRNFESSVTFVYDCPEDQAVNVWSTLYIKLPMPPSVNQWTRVFRNTIVASPVAKLYIKLAKEQMELLNIKPSISMLQIETLLHGLPPNSDVDGRNKQLLDCMHGPVVHNDYAFRSCTVTDARTKPDHSFVHIKISKFIEPDCDNFEA